MRRISHRELRNDSGKILRELRDGEEFEVTVNGESMGVLTMRPAPERPQRSVSADRMRRMFSDLAPLTPQQRETWKKDIRDAYDDELDDKAHDMTLWTSNVADFRGVEKLVPVTGP